MTDSLSSSFTPSIGKLPQNTLVIDTYGCIQFASSTWNAYNNEYGIFPMTEWVGSNCFELLEGVLVHSSYTVALHESLQCILRGEQLVVSMELSIATLKKGQRSFRLEAFPLTIDLGAGTGSFVISLFDVRSVLRSPHMQPVRLNRPSHNKSACKHKLTPICASCKSIRTPKEEWISTEQFLQQTLSMQFTHDICPDCIQQLYPKYAEAFRSSIGSL